ncbi:CHASE4 domain-containing protein [Calothrix sp. NIES-3974]|uniref:CHASE4 domain-containing protein n=1 Tax=Calothrix sp. NIES-3974 TaxID=2005462 RepID=UPI000B5F49FE|nr:CHASE4 domain-containing protein [Calothrix sp. NIES-3974]BAZ06051.1 putative histidine kinase [Calothrix sp. NIES-3974]
MKLRQKTLLIVNATLASLIGVLYVASSSILIGSIRTAEENEAQQTIKGVQNLLTQTQENFRDRFADWSAWDDTYRFIRDRNQDYVQANLVPSTLANLKINTIVFVNQSGRIIYGTGFDQGTKTETPIPQALASRLANPQDLLLQRPDLTTKQTGIVMSPSAPILITSQPIVTSDIQGPVRGSLIVGRNLDATQIQRLVVLLTSNKFNYLLGMELYCILMG